MSEKAQYRTRQITELENYLCSMEGKHVTVSDICKYFKSQGISIGTTTVYRQLDRMVEQGLVAKYMVDGTSSACYEYLGHDEHCHKHICFHCKCEKCGKLIHLECGEMTHLGSALEILSLNGRFNTFWLWRRNQLSAFCPARRVQ